MRVLVTGGAGYIGSHTCLELLENGYGVVVLDNTSNGSAVALERVRRIVGGGELFFVEGDVRDRALLERLFARHDIGAVIHFAGLKAVGQSVADPLAYYDVNVGGTIALARAMEAVGVRTLVFSSSATVYGAPRSVPITEDAPLQPASPYGRTKLVVEELLRDLANRPGEPWRIACLRYFNPVGAHASGLIGEDPEGTPANLMPFIAQVAVGRRERLRIFGDDYPTRDGTGVRDYVHVVDLARGHLAALAALGRSSGGVLAVNLGTGRGHSVREVVAAFERVSGRRVPCEVMDRRPGDVAECYASTALAERVLGWKAQYDLERMCEDAWRWQSANPQGYRGASA